MNIPVTHTVVTCFSAISSLLPFTQTSSTLEIQLKLHILKIVKGGNALHIALALCPKRESFLITCGEQQGGDGSGSEVVTWLWHLQLHQGGGELLSICKGSSEEECVGAPPLLCTYGWIMTHILQMLFLPHPQSFYSLSLPLPELYSRIVLA